MSLIFLALILLIPPPQPLSRLPARGPKTPRDGPAPRWRRQAPPDHLAIAADLDLYAACLHAGLSPAAASAALVDVGTEPTTHHAWRTVAALLAIGVPAQRAWAEVAEVPGLQDLAALATMSERSGAAMSQACERIATGLRDSATAQATARAERAGVLIALPLTLCFLPAFLVLGLAPVVISLGTQLLVTH
ncbi:MAG: type II secretion system F family protein [Corynebacterium sp.]|uniref:type II secretion system F family protein n=1 Tax=Corynebacterium sp. TaxID=1720 RepID=UPI0026E099C9|nr:type II secretion system F family protein [Corynebacterium sp.]MDO5668500.1 type II secretion system F family protein [Corynebacterium sp.]